MEYILSVDLGTTAIKVALVSETGDLLKSAVKEYTLDTRSTLEVELDVDVYWNAFKEGIQAVLRESDIDKTNIRAIGLSAQGETLIVVDESGQPMRPAIVWMDNRAQREAKELQGIFDQKTTYEITGQVSIVPTWPAAKILWLKNNETELFARAGKFLLIEEYFIHRLAGTYAAEGSLLCSTLYWDISTKNWWSDMLTYLDVPEAKLPEIWEPGEKVGPLLPDIAQELGLSTDTTVCTGALDQAAGTIGVGNIQPGIFTANTGGALAICATVEKPFIDPKFRMPCHYHAIKDTYMAHTFTTGGMVLKWFRDAFCQVEMAVDDLTGMDSYNILGKEASGIAPGCDGLTMLPHLGGAMAPEDNPLAKGVFYGITLQHKKPHFVRAIMESVAFIIRRNIEVIEDLGINFNEIRVLGGGSKSPIWTQINCDVLNREVSVMGGQEAACLGAAMLAGNAIGMFESMETAARIVTSAEKTYYPDIKAVKTYDKMYQQYINLYDALVGMFAKGE